jgi:hypothetical protein
MRKSRALISFVVLAFLFQTESVVGQEIRSACDQNMISVLKKLSDPNWNQITGAVYDKVPLAALSTFNERRSRTAVAIVEVPFHEAEYKSVFKLNRDITASEEDDIRAARDQYFKSGFNGFMNLRGMSESERTAGFADFLKHQPQDFVVMVGHNWNGEFVFRNGDHLSLVLMSKTCTALLKKCIFVSCRSKDYITDGSVGVSRDLKMNEGIWIGSRIATWIDSQREPVALADLKIVFSKMERDAHIRYHASYIVFSGCGAAVAAAGAGYGVYLLVEGAES